MMAMGKKTFIAVVAIALILASTITGIVLNAAEANPLPPSWANPEMTVTIQSPQNGTSAELPVFVNFTAVSSWGYGSTSRDAFFYVLDGQDMKSQGTKFPQIQFPGERPTSSDNKFHWSGQVTLASLNDGPHNLTVYYGDPIDNVIYYNESWSATSQFYVVTDNQFLSTPDVIAETSSSPVSSSPPEVQWQQILPSDFGTSATCMIQTSDGGYLVGGEGNYKNGAPGYLVKLDASGNIQWNRTYNGITEHGNYIDSIVQTGDGGYTLLTGGLWAGNLAYQLIKTDWQGNLEWNVTFSSEFVVSMVQTSDNGYALAGYVANNQVQNGRLESQLWLAKLNSAGTQLWNRTYGEFGDTETSSVIQTGDGGYALAGKSNAYGSAGEYDFIVVKADASGNQQWLKTFGGAGGDSEASSLIQTIDGGYVLAGSTTAYGLGGEDAWLVKIDSSGNLVWTHTYGGTGMLPNFYGNLTGSPIAGSNGTADDYAYSVIQTSDGGLAFVGASSTVPPPNIAITSVWLVKTDQSGSEAWNETFGDPFFTWAGNSLIEASDGSFAIAGYKQEPGFPWEGNYYIVKTEPSLPLPSSPTASPTATASTSPSPAQALEFPLTKISADGSISPLTAPIQRSGKTYVFTGDLNGQLLVDKDNIVIDGAGYALQGNGTYGSLYIRQSQTGINLTGEDKVTIKDLQIYNYNIGIYINNSNYAAVSESTLTQNGYGIFVDASSFAVISGNNITQSNYGVFLNYPSENNKIINNNIKVSSSFDIMLNQSSGNVIYSNSMGGMDFESGSNNLIVENSMFSGFYGIYLDNGNSSIIAANNFTACSFGISSPGGGNASNNLIYMNDFNNSHINVFGQASNSWDNGTVGNFWSDYLTRYPNATEIDDSGIGNIPYAMISGYNGYEPESPNMNNVDHCPLLSPVSADSAQALSQALVSTHNWSQASSAPSSQNLTLLFLSLAAVVVVLVAAAVVLARALKRKKPT